MRVKEVSCTADICRLNLCNPRVWRHSPSVMTRPVEGRRPWQHVRLQGPAAGRQRRRAMYEAPPERGPPYPARRGGPAGRADATVGAAGRRRRLSGRSDRRRLTPAPLVQPIDVSARASGTKTTAARRCGAAADRPVCPSPAGRAGQRRPR